MRTDKINPVVPTETRDASDFASEGLPDDVFIVEVSGDPIALSTSLRKKQIFWNAKR
jgi:hypothetical protein